MRLRITSVLFAPASLSLVDFPRGPGNTRASYDVDGRPRRSCAKHGLFNSWGWCFQDPSLYDRVPQGF